MTNHLVSLTQRTAATALLVCLPPAGATGGAFASWASGLPADWDLQAPVRPAESTFSRLIPPLAESILARLAEKGRSGTVALFGHSLGALIAFSLARHLRDAGVPPCGLLIAAASAPGIPLPLPVERDFLEYARRLGGTTETSLGHPVQRQRLESRIRMDLALRDSFEYVPDHPLPCPIAVFGGRQDEDVPIDSLLAWRSETTGEFSAHLFDGGHLFIQEHLSPFLKVLGDELGRWLPERGDPGARLHVA